MRIGGWAACVAMVLAAGLVQAAEKKVLFVDSYHEGYAWSDGITNGVKKVIGDKAELRVHRMDTKRNPSDDFKKTAGEEAKRVVEEFKPDVLIVADDNAMKHIVAEYFKDADLPVVFCGLNWDEKVYGLPFKNTTGMVEVPLFKQAMDILKPLVGGNRIGALGPDNETNHKEFQNARKTFEPDLKPFFAKDFADWKAHFLKAQEECDILIVESDGGLYNDKAEEMKAFVLEHTKIPTISFYDFMAPYAVLSYAKSSEEQGEWAAAAALKILSGTPAADIAIERNRNGLIFVNAALMQKTQVRIPLAVVKQATILK